MQVYVYFTCQFIMNISFLILLLITKKELINFCQFKNHIITRHFTRKKILGLGPGCEPKPKPKINSEFNSIHFGIEIKKRLQFLTPLSFWV